MIIVDKETRNPIMQEISAKHGVGTQAHAICLSIPVDAAVGLNSVQSE